MFTKISYRIQSVCLYNIKLIGYRTINNVLGTSKNQAFFCLYTKIRGENALFFNDNFHEAKNTVL